MKNNSIYIAFFFFIVFATSCAKEKPSLGDYYGIFTYEVSSIPGLVKTATIEITESSKNTIVINGSELDKDGKNISGRIASISCCQFGVIIDGEWSHKLFSKNYKIEGTFIEEYYQGGSSYQNSGTFEIKSN